MINRSGEELITTQLFQSVDMTRVGFGRMGTPGQIDQLWQHFEENGEMEAIAPEQEHDNPPLISPAGRVPASVENWGLI
ncbi:hypothetical protein [Laspinema olomoucense]|uniref:Uncharacterized protein n=1 Tax=Laspinema olomoucense D3b TaxID=2953688 RepID=A0ABT2NDX9_9CYAN|nr:MULTISPECIES: hypothetical protein [unclassified Laspinema]MCT7974246.1 hypothetical protein [Laspinema sp. D3d]MCT7980671.1 hypothetical protein [Laspinema sp. D3b]MCT7991220.1 hypothetical protein [Laspinema sp. D3a]MCT7996926.1 hypothetical protein [Laspinema sp. D3c]